MKRCTYLVHCIVYSFFVMWNLLLGYITYNVWRYDYFATYESRQWLINLEVVAAASILLFSIWAWVWLVTGKFRGSRCC